MCTLSAITSIFVTLNNYSVYEMTGGKVNKDQCQRLSLFKLLSRVSQSQAEIK